jgi:hypothetical protein
MVFGGKPEIVHLDVPVFDFRLLNPKGRILRWFSFDANHSKILRIDPDFPAIEKLVLALRKQVQHILPTLGRVLISSQSEIVIVRAEGGEAPVFRVGRFLLAFQQPLENMIDDELRAVRRNYFEFL